MAEHQILKTLEGKDKFGEVEFFTNQSRSAEVKSIGFTILFALGREDFLSIISNVSEDREMFHLIKGAILIYFNYIRLNSLLQKL
jgi:CRP-like cAMP-binding protein